VGKSFRETRKDKTNMPIYDFTCTDGHEFEELIRGHDVVTVSCTVEGCTCIANKKNVYAVTTVGPVSSDLEAFNSTLLSPRQRAAGIELKTKKQIEAYERMRGLRRHDPNSISTKAAISDTLDDHHDIMKIKKQDGCDAAADHVYKTEMQQATGWNNAEYSNWKRTHDAAKTAALDGRVGLESVDRRTTDESSS